MATKQIQPLGVRWLLARGARVGEELPRDAYWHLDANGWLGTKGENDEAGLVQHVGHPLTPSGVSAMEPEGDFDEEDGAPEEIYWEWIDSVGEQEGEPITLPVSTKSARTHRFLHDRLTGIYYTILDVRCSGSRPLSVPLIIKHRGAQWLLQHGASLGEEFTEAGLWLLFERRWAYIDEDRLPDWEA